MAHPHSCVALKGVTTKSGHAAEKREQKKHQKYDQQVTQSGSQPSCIPLVFEQYTVDPLLILFFINFHTGLIYEIKMLTKMLIGSDLNPSWE